MRSVVYIILLSCSFSLFSQEGQTSVSLIAQSEFWSTTLISPLIKSRCQKYENKHIVDQIVDGLVDPFVELDCDKATSLMLSSLDFKIFTSQEGYKVKVIFYKKLMEIMKQKKTGIILSALLKKIEHKNSSPFNLYSFLREHPQNLTKEEAVEFLATLFQDTNGTQHLFYLNDYKNQNPSKINAQYLLNLDYLQKILPTFQEAFYDFQMTSYNNLFNNLQLYPLEQRKLFAQSFQPAIYHFYIPAYLSQILKKNNLQNYYAFIAPFSLRLLYEYLFNPSNGITDWNSLLITLGTLDPGITSYYKQVDLFLSLKGTLWSLGIIEDLDFNQFSNLARSNVPKLLRIIRKKL